MNKLSGLCCHLGLPPSGEQRGQLLWALCYILQFQTKGSPSKPSWYIETRNARPFIWSTTNGSFSFHRRADELRSWVFTQLEQILIDNFDVHQNSKKRQFKLKQQDKEMSLASSIENEGKTCKHNMQHKNSVSTSWVRMPNAYGLSIVSLHKIQVVQVSIWILLFNTILSSHLIKSNTVHF